MFANNSFFWLLGFLCLFCFVLFFWGGGRRRRRIKIVKSTKTDYVLRFSFFSLNDIESKILYIDIVKLFLQIILLGLLYFFCRSAYSDDWDIFTYTQEWPVAVCIKGKEEVKQINPEIYRLEKLFIKIQL